MTTLKVGDVIDLADRDYKFGMGRLILRVTMIGKQQRLADGVWLDVEGLELRQDGTQYGQQPRPALVRLKGLRLWRPPQAQP